MIPIKLSVEGLYSYRVKQEVNFRQLIGASIFGIFGKVGSGKTSLIEAISFVLYGKSERLNNHDNRQYNMMNLKSNYLRIDFEFQAGPDGQRYRFVYEAKRNTKRHEDINKQSRRMFSWVDEGWQPFGSDKDNVAVLAEQILGLDYDNFKRTIIIPQNQFREFLELSPTERNEMMKRLFKLEQYDLSGRVLKLTRANNEQLAELRGLLGPLEAATPEAIEAAAAVVTVYIEQIEIKQLTINTLNSTEKRLCTLQTQFSQRDKAEAELERAGKNEAFYLQKEQQIKQFEQCQLVFKSDFEQVEKLTQKVTYLTKEQQQARDAHQQATDKLPAIIRTYESARTTYENRDSLIQQHDELDTVQEVRTLDDVIRRKELDWKDVDSQRIKQKKEVDRLTETAKNAETDITLLGSKPSQLEQLYELKNWFTAHKPLKRQAEDLAAKLTKHELAVDKLKARKSSLLTGYPDEWQPLELKQLPAIIETEIDRLKQSRKAQEAEYQQAVLHEKLQQYTNELINGKPCPLCGSVHHSIDKQVSNYQISNVPDTLAKLNLLDQRIDQTTNLQLAISKLLTEVRSEMENRKRLLTERGEAVLLLTTHEDTFRWDEYSTDSEPLIEERLKAENIRQKKLTDAHQTFLIMMDKCRKETELLNVYIGQHDSIANELASLTGQRGMAVKSLNHFALTDVATWTLSQIAGQRDLLLRQHEQAKTNFDQAGKAKGEAEKALSDARKDAENCTVNLQLATNELLDLQKTIDENLISHQVSRVLVRQLLGSHLDVAGEGRKIADYRALVSGLHQQIQALTEALGNQTFDPAELASVSEQLKTKITEKEELSKAQGRAETELTTLKKQWKDKQKHQERSAELELRKSELQQMERLFKAQGFVSYVSSVYLKNLCATANQRFFKLTNSQLKLELDTNNNFQVRDFLNGGEVRLAKTLSGGQMFQAALSLALALSDNIQHLTKAKQNLFFLDEGFGTLDKDSLLIVFQTLKSLREENRVVGLISHVDDLQHEVETYIRTEMTEEGSQIRCSWQ